MSKSRIFLSNEVGINMCYQRVRSNNTVTNSQKVKIDFSMNNTNWNLTSASDIWRDIFVSEKEWERKKELIVVDCNEWCFLDGGKMLYNENKSSVSSVEYFEL